MLGQDKSLQPAMSGFVRLFQVFHRLSNGSSQSQRGNHPGAWLTYSGFTMCLGRSRSSVFSAL